MDNLIFGDKIFHYIPDTFMEQFRIAPEKISEYKNVLNQRSLVTNIAMVIGGVAGTYIMIKNDANKDDINPLFISIPVFTVLFWIMIKKRRKVHREAAESFVLTITDDLITREQAYTKPISLRKSEIRKIKKTKNGNLLVAGNRILQQIDIPPQVEQYTVIEDTLGTIQPIQQLSYNIGLIITGSGLLVGIATLGILVATNKIIVGICGTLVTGMLLIFIYLIMTGKIGDEKIKKSVWLYCIAAISYLAITISKLMA